MAKRYVIRGATIGLAAGLALWLYLLLTASCISFSSDGGGGCPTELLEIIKHKLQLPLRVQFAVILAPFFVGLAAGFLTAKFKALRQA